LFLDLLLLGDRRPFFSPRQPITTSLCDELVDLVLTQWRLALSTYSIGGAIEMPALAAQVAL
jgi:hypothetical protein